MSLESAAFISQLDPLNPVGATDPKSRGDDHLRLVKSVLKNQFPNATAAINPTPEEFNYLVGVTAPIQEQISGVGQRKNLIWNGAMDVWQDGRDQGGITALSRSMADGFRFDASNHGSWTVARTSGSLFPAAGRNLNFSLRCVVGASDTVVGTTDFAMLSFMIEGFDWQELYQRPAHLSFWARSTTPGTYHVALRNAGFDRALILPFALSGVNVPKLIQIPITAVPSGGTWNFQSGVGLQVSFVLASGTGFHAATGTWQAGNFLASAGQVNLAAIVNNDFIISDIRLHGGAVRNDVVLRSFAETLREAQRRFVKTFPYDVQPASNVGSNVGCLFTRGPSRTVVYQYNTMRAIPFITTYNPTNAGNSWQHTVDAGDQRTPSSTVSDSSVAVAITGAPDATYAIHLIADARL